HSGLVLRQVREKSPCIMNVPAVASLGLVVLRGQRLAVVLAALVLGDTLRSAGTDSFDVVVYGGVPCGIAAAIAAAREGASVLLVEPTKHVGGLNTSGLNTAETEHMLKWTFGGIALEFYERLGRHYGMKGPAFYFE